MCRRVATALAVVAALALVIDGALGTAGHQAAAAPAQVGHFHVHAHSHVASDHQLVQADVAAQADAADHGSSSPSGADFGGNCCSCACSAAMVLPSLTAQVAPFQLIRDTAFANHRHGDGIVPEGLRRPPRPLSIA